MKQLNEKDFEQALSKTLVTGTYILDKNYVLDYSFKKLHFQNLKIINGSFTCSLFQNCKFTNVIFKSIYLDECDFQNCHFENVIFKNCTTENIQFANCTNTPKIV
ncbi:MAG: hypothetical protein GF353_07380 [Candidatus Lokiarchaeota archaeon]|nr:hypothetical protein [Candidatus Lokiarchaeota archaeon]